MKTQKINCQGVVFSIGKKLVLHFQPKKIESFEAETTNPIELQRGGWQNILDNFKKYTESNNY